MAIRNRHARRTLPLLGRVLALAAIVALAAATAAEPVEYDLRDRELVLPAGNGFWQVVSATLEPRIVRIDLVGRGPGGREAGSFGVTMRSRLITYQDQDSAWPLQRIDGLVAGQVIRAAGASVSLYFEAPHIIFGGLQLELVTPEGETLRLSMSLPGAIQARRQFDAGESAYREQRWQNAVDHFGAAVARRPNHTASWRGLGRSLVRLRHNDEAIVALGRALDGDPRVAYDHALLGFALLDVATDRRSAARARQHIELARELGYDWEELGYFMARSHELTGDVGSAQQGYQSYLQVGRAADHIAYARRYLEQHPEPVAPVQPAPTLAEGVDRPAAADPGGGRPDEDPGIDPGETAVSEPAPVESDPAPDPAPAAVAEPDPESESDPDPDPAHAADVAPRPVAPGRPAMVDPDHVAFAVEGVSEFGIERVVLENLYVGLESWILRVRPETSHTIGPGSHLLSNRGDRQELLSQDAAGDRIDLTFGVPSGRARSVTLQLIDPESGAEGDCTFVVPGYDRYRELVRTGHRLLGEKQYEQAITAYSEALPLRAGDANVWWRRASCYQRTGDTGRARYDIEKAASLSPENGDIQALLGHVLLVAGDRAEAARALTSAIELGADSPSTLLDLGDARSGLGDPAAARKLYLSILERFPGGSVAKEARERVSELDR